jgi:RNA polymerase sigma factor (sigma-70 family)
MNDDNWLADQFEANRNHLRSVAYRMLGSATEADDAVQESWLRLSRSDTTAIDNLGGWLTTVVARVSLDMLRSRTTRQAEPLGEQPQDLLAPANESDPEQQALLADSVGLALLVVLDTLSPAERVAFVLHDMFGMPFDEIAPIVGRSPVATRQLASRGRGRVQGVTRVPESDLSRQRQIVAAFLAASRGGDFDALVAVLDPDAVLRADDAALRTGASEAVGASAVAENFFGRAHAAQLARIDDTVGLVWAPGGQTRVVFAFTITDDLVSRVDLVADADDIQEFEIVILDKASS